MIFSLNVLYHHSTQVSKYFEQFIDIFNFYLCFQKYKKKNC